MVTRSTYLDRSTFVRRRVFMSGQRLPVSRHTRATTSSGGARVASALRSQRVRVPVASLLRTVIGVVKAIG